MTMQMSLPETLAPRTRIDYASYARRVMERAEKLQADEEETYGPLADEPINTLAWRIQRAIMTLSKDLSAASVRRYRAAMRHKLRTDGFAEDFVTQATKLPRKRSNWV